MSATTSHVVIVGGGQAAASAVTALRQFGWTGRITLLGEEAYPPYQRPPLSKAYMKGELAEERLYFKPSTWYAENDVDVRLQTRVSGIDTDGQQVSVDGDTLGYDALLLATGSRARKLPLPGADLGNVFELRGLADVKRIQPTLQPGSRLVVIGAGYIGLEAAAVGRQLGLDVTVLEYAPRVLARVTSPLVSEFYAAEHGRQGVDIRCDARLARLQGDGTVSGAELEDGTIVPADVVLVGIGIVPNQELAADAGIDCDDGITVDRDARTSRAEVFAAGDCTRRPLVHYDRVGRLESVHNAIEQGKLAAAAIAGKPRPVEDCPWFWSDQYDIKLQIAGLSAGYDDVVVRGDPAERKFAAFYLRDSRLLSTDAINSPQEFVLSKKLIVAGKPVDPDRLADPAVPMKEIVAGS